MPSQPAVVPLLTVLLLLLLQTRMQSLRSAHNGSIRETLRYMVQREGLLSSDAAWVALLHHDLTSFSYHCKHKAEGNYSTRLPEAHHKHTAPRYTVFVYTNCVPLCCCSVWRRGRVYASAQ
ncbi:hypothetical protein RR46_00963 [Papilio xuthus]|uniref:Secreted protein n=1 Tax=Papilio xuthus TaxID=66420 RepID=A0A0N1PG64_PAPXU|nr:hypothetical protein RR46_00963 [Papilio xuthus]